jgi:type IV pilus assembly protein PilX
MKASSMSPSHLVRTRPQHLGRQQGIALVFVMFMLSIAAAMGLATATLTLLGEKSSRNERDRQIAFQSAELAISDAEADIMNPSARGCVFPMPASNEGRCSSDDALRGVCGLAPSAGINPPPMYRQVDWANDDNATRAFVFFGEKTNRAAGLSIGNGVGPARTPSYIIVPSNVSTFARIAGSAEPYEIPAGRSYRVYALGYGTTPQTQVLLEAHITKPISDKSCSPT